MSEQFIKSHFGASVPQQYGRTQTCAASDTQCSDCRIDDLESLLSAETEARKKAEASTEFWKNKLGEVQELLQAAEQRIKESQEQEPECYLYLSKIAGEHLECSKDITKSAFPVFKQPIIPPELEELIDRNQDLCGEIAQINRENAELTRKLAEHEKTVESFSRMYTQEELNKLLSEARTVPEGWKLVPATETEEMQDSVRGILQILRGKTGCTYKDVYTHCKARGDDVTQIPPDSGYVTEASAAALIFRTMLAASPKPEGVEK